jgi:uncharacterized protein YprB with RNaseH-like and TPR domain
MGFIPEHIEIYLNSTSPDITGAEVSRLFKIPARTARRYVQTFRQSRQEQLELNVQPQFLNAVVFDIETTDFGTEGYSGRLICCSFLPLDSAEVITLETTFDDHGDDKTLLQNVAKQLSKYAFHIGHNIAAFDYNWLNSRLRYHHLETLDSAFYFDTFQVAKSMGLATSKGLGNLIDYFGLEGIKTTIYRTSWSRISSPNAQEFEEALESIVTHCQYDVEANRRLFDVLLPYSLTNGRACAWKLSKVQGNYWKHI